MRQQTQNSRQNGGGWMGPALYAISIQEKILIILDDPLPHLSSNLTQIVTFLFIFFFKNRPSVKFCIFDSAHKGLLISLSNLISPFPTSCIILSSETVLHITKGLSNVFRHHPLSSQIQSPPSSEIIQSLSHPLKLP